jgi:lysozyme family protein
VISNWPAALSAVIKHEGGWVHHKDDPGGITNLGVTRRVWEEWTGMPASDHNMRGLTVEKVLPLYRARYWSPIGGDELPGGVDYAVFDLAVNSGVRRASLILQEVLGVTADGSIGPKTLQATKGVPPGSLIDSICDRRMEFLRSLPHFATFGYGWTRRVSDVRREAKRMA